MSPRLSTTRPSRRRRAATSVAVLATLGGFALSGALTAAPSHAAKPRDAVQRDLDGLIASGVPGALAHVRAADGTGRDYTAGVAERNTTRKVPVDGQVRIGSGTKPFVAVVTLQLVGEGKVKLDSPVETYLPNLVRGDGIDGRKITVRQLLQHTSGLPNYTDAMVLDFPKYHHRYLEPRELLDLAFTQKGAPAGGEWSYSNTNYILAGLIIQKVTGRPLAEQIDKRIVQPLGLRDTYFPGVGEQKIRGRHPHGYFRGVEEGAPWTDVTVMDPSWGWAAGQMISTPSEVARFYTALLRGKLLRPAELKQMRTTVPAGSPAPGVTASYGLGIFRTELACGRVSWGHGGTIHGFVSRVGFLDDGRGMVLVVNELDALGDRSPLDTTVNASLCR
ncbi:serine hydrolase domain-containing protein [Jidongwangia harbinensis]|uniref:serine hydrolase domain-containing protein n=1 Tax=Jidongwangia harbinensis TaxID=2878561 RepID=UPI001CDA011C|nr:serine hydrolase domain-containing protein [Jidongwangia harbinensis]MCA2219330.1 beta-lactamase family protein [Jidongwangia harbinensis]